MNEAHGVKPIRLWVRVKQAFFQTLFAVMYDHLYYVPACWMLTGRTGAGGYSANTSAMKEIEPLFITQKKIKKKKPNKT